MKLLSLSTTLMILSIMAHAQTTRNYFAIDSVVFERETYFLAWSSFSNTNYYKHEYLRKGEDFDTGFNKMVIIETLLNGKTPRELVTIKIKEIERRKGEDPIANYEVIENTKTGEFLIDFLISSKGIYEWNAYRYKQIATQKGNAVMLFAVCIRGFNEGELTLDEFFPFIQKHRKEMIWECKLNCAI